MRRGCQQGNLAYVSDFRKNATKEIVHSSPYFDPVTSVLSLKPITKTVASQSNPAFYIPSGQRSPSYKYYTKSNPAYYFHDDIPSYSMNIATNSVSFQSPYSSNLPMIYGNTPTQFHKKSKQPISINNLSPIQEPHYMNYFETMDATPVQNYNNIMHTPFFVAMLSSNNNKKSSALKRN